MGSTQVEIKMSATFSRKPQANLLISIPTNQGYAKPEVIYYDSN
jgi:hypothetical protein